MSTLISIPILILVVIFQSAVLTRMTLLHASGDLVLVVVASWMMQERVKAVWQWALIAAILMGFVSQVPWWGYLIGYGLVVGMGIVLKKRVWRAPLLSLFTMVVLGTVAIQGVNYVILRVQGVALDPVQAFNLVLLPGILLNLLFAAPVNSLIREVADWFYPDEAEA